MIITCCCCRDSFPSKFFNQKELKKNLHERICIECWRENNFFYNNKEQTTIQCSACEEMVSINKFSKEQFDKAKENRQCNVCTVTKSDMNKFSNESLSSSITKSGSSSSISSLGSNISNESYNGDQRRKRLNKAGLNLRKNY
eukprot:Pgem_evm1s9118